jgi:hypothetical protein
MKPSKKAAQSRQQTELCSSETPVGFHQATWRCITDDTTLLLITVGHIGINI